MSEWWTYSLTDFLLFSPRTYYRLFELYNADGLAAAARHARARCRDCVSHAARPRAWSGRAIAAILAALWLFVAWAYLLERYDTINWAARYFAIAFVLQAALLGLDRSHPRSACAFSTRDRHRQGSASRSFSTRSPSIP